MALESKQSAFTYIPKRVKSYIQVAFTESANYMVMKQKFKWKHKLTHSCPTSKLNLLI